MIVFPKAYDVIYHWKRNYHMIVFPKAYDIIYQRNFVPDIIYQRNFVPVLFMLDNLVLCAAGKD